MKTGMEWPLVILILVIVLALAIQGWNSAQVELSAAEVQAMAAGQKMPAGFLEIGELGLGWIVKAAAGTFLTGLGATLAYKTWEWFKIRKRGQWQPGPNANYQLQPKITQPRIPSEAELWRMATLQQMAANGGGYPNSQTTAIRTANHDDEPDITF